MAKFEEVFVDTQALFATHISESGLEQVVNIKVLANNTLKEIGKVVKANDLLKHMTNEDVIILLNEVIFEGLEDEQKKMVVEDLLAQVYFDPEKDKLTLIKPDFIAFSLIIQKYSFEKYLVLKESIKTLFNVAEEQEA